MCVCVSVCASVTCGLYTAWVVRMLSHNHHINKEDVRASVRNTILVQPRLQDGMIRIQESRKPWSVAVFCDDACCPVDSSRGPRQREKSFFAHVHSDAPRMMFSELFTYRTVLYTKLLNQPGLVFFYLSNSNQNQRALGRHAVGWHLGGAVPTAASASFSRFRENCRTAQNIRMSWWISDKD